MADFLPEVWGARDSANPLDRRWLRWGIVMGIWTMLGVLDASQSFAYYAYLGLPIEWWRALVLGMAEWYAWALIALVIFELGRRFPLRQNRWLASCAVHVPASFALSLAELALDAVVVHWVLGEVAEPRPPGALFTLFLSAKLVPHLGIYWAILGVQQVLDYYRVYRERELRASQLEARLTEARLQVLQMQLHPHFLFNTLHAIAALVHKDPDAAEEVIARLGELLRLTLETDQTQEVPLRQELEFLHPYLEIQQARFGPRLTVELAVAPDTLNARVPRLILQPLVENALRHGIGPRPGPGRLAVRARREQAVLLLQVQDDGLGLDSGKRANGTGGIGLANTRERLRQLYGAEQRLEVGPAKGGGVLVTVALPFHEEGTPGNEPNSDADRG